MRSFRRFAHGAALLVAALVLAACGSGVGGDDSGGGGGGGEPVASQFVLGGPPECPKRPFCIPGFEEVYGIEFEDFQPLDIGGPQTVNALKAGRVDVGLLFATTSAIQANDFVALEDDQNLQPAENITPLIREDALDDTIESALNDVSGALTTETMVELNSRVEIDQEDPADVAADFLEQEGISAEGGGSGELTVGAVAFAENQIVAEMYAQVLEQAGYTVNRQTDLRSREILYPAMKSGEVDLAPEYTGSLLVYLDPDAETTGADAQELIGQLDPLISKDGMTLLEPSDANNTNALVVTSETAEQYGLETVSDLAQPAE